MKKSDLLAYVEGELSNEEAERIEQELAEKPELIEELTEMCKDQLLLAEHFSEQKKKAPIPVKAFKKSRKAKKKNSPFPLIFTAVAAMLIIGFFVLSRVTVDKLEVARVLSTDNISVIRKNQQVKLSINDPLYLEDQIQTGGNSLSFRYTDGSKVMLSSDTDILLSQNPNGGKKIHVSKGIVKAIVEPQDISRQMVISTNHSESTVLGTVLEVVTSSKSSTLDVIEGKVRFTNLSNPKDFVEVQSGDSASINEGEPVVLQQALNESFSDQNEVYKKWEKLKSPYTMSVNNGHLEIEIQNLSPEDYIEKGAEAKGLGKSTDWTKDLSGLRTKKSFNLPFTVEFDLEPSPTTSLSLNSLIMLDSGSEINSFWIGRRGNSIEAKWMDDEVIFTKPVRAAEDEKWQVVILNDELFVSINSQEIFKGKMNRKFAESYKVSFIVDAKRDFPQKTSVKFDDVKIRSVKK